MASPFRVFRKRQKLWMAILGVLIMIAFVIGSAGMFGSGMFSSESSRPETPVVVTTKYGDIDETEMAQMIQGRNILNEFLRRLAARTIEVIRLEQLRPDASDEALLTFVQRQMLDLGMLQPATETSVIEQLILQKKADDLGVVVSDETINQALRHVSQNLITDEQMAELLAQANLTEGRLFDGLRGQLKAQYVRRMLDDPLGSAPPALRWEYYRRLKQTATAQAIPVKVEDFMGEVADPSESELVAYFEEYKSEPGLPDSPEPGFYQPAKAQFQYVKADFEALVDAAEAQVTEQEVSDFYEKHKEAFPYTDKDPPAEVEALEGAEDAASNAEAEQSKSEQPDANEASPDAAPDEKPSDEPTPTDSTDEDASNDNAAQPAAPAEESASPAPNDEASQSPVPAMLRGAAGEDLLVAQGDGAAPGDAPPDDATEGLPDSSPAPQPERMSEAQFDALSVQFQVPDDLRGGPRPEFEPLWKVEKRIRRQLAVERYVKDVERVFNELKEKMTSFYDDNYDSFQAFNKALREGTDPPAPPSFDLAKQVEGIAGFSAHETPLLPAHEMPTETDLGKSFLSANVPFVTFAYRSLRPFFVRDSRDMENNYYLFWKVNETKEFVPTLDQVRDQVVRSWKLREARKLALDRAEELARRAGDAGKTLQEAFVGEAGVEVVDTGPFSWLTFGSAHPAMGGIPRLGEPKGVDMPGQDFMREVFHLEPGETGVSMNEPESVAYVVQLESIEPLETVLREQFIIDPFARYATSAVIDRRERARDWSKQVTEEADLDWERLAR